MDEIIGEWYLAVLVKVITWKMEKHHNTMSRLISAGEAYHSARLSELDLKNQRLGMQLHVTLLRMMVLHAIESQKRDCREYVCSTSLVQQQLLAQYGGGIVQKRGI